MSRTVEHIPKGNMTLAQWSNLVGMRTRRFTSFLHYNPVDQVVTLRHHVGEDPIAVAYAVFTEFPDTTAETYHQNYLRYIEQEVGAPSSLRLQQGQDSPWIDIGVAYESAWRDITARNIVGQRVIQLFLNADKSLCAARKPSLTRDVVNTARHNYEISPLRMALVALYTEAELRVMFSAVLARRAQPIPFAPVAIIEEELEELEEGEGNEGNDMEEKEEEEEEEFGNGGNVVNMVEEW